MSSIDETTFDHYIAALDEIFNLRKALAYEARCLEVHIGFSKFPKSRRPIAEEQVRRMREAARGGTANAYAPIADSAYGALCELAGGVTLTRRQWEGRDRT